MNRLSGWLAALGVDFPKPNRSFGKESSLVFSDVLLIVGLGLALLVVLALGVYAWMKFRRNRRKHVSGGEKVYRSASGEEGHDELDSDADGEDEDEDETEHHHHSHGHRHHGRRRYKYRVRRRGHRSRNPTLSETGGLPPVKPQEPTKPC